MSDQKAKDMVQMRDALLVIVSTLRLLVRQGLAIRGHEDIDSNFMQTLQVRWQDIEALANWLLHADSKTETPLPTHLHSLVVPRSAFVDCI